MPAIQLTPAERKEFRAEAHHLDPVVMIGGDGLTAAVKKETDAALKAHGLIKVRVFSDDRAERETIFQTLADELNAAPIQHIGKLLVLWRPKPVKERAEDEDRMPGPRDVKVLKFSKRGGQRPEVKVLRVLGNQRLTPVARSSAPNPSRPASRSVARPERRGQVASAAAGASLNPGCSDARTWQRRTTTAAGTSRCQPGARAPDSRAPRCAVQSPTPPARPATGRPQ